MNKLKPCRDCETPISRRAKVCPHCGLKKPHQHPFARGFNDFANGLIGLGLLLTILALAFGVLAGDDRRVAGDALEVGRVYILQDRTPQYPPRELRRVMGDMILPAYTPIEVLERTTHKGRPWYWTRWIRPRTLDRSRDSEGWIDSRDLASGAVLSH